MPRYIDAEPMPRGAFWESLTDKEKCGVLGYLLSAPTADVVEVRHGEWIHNNDEMICSACGNEALMDEVYYESPYCPDCGAQMDGKVDS